MNIGIHAPRCEAIEETMPLEDHARDQPQQSFNTTSSIFCVPRLPQIPTNTATIDLSKGDAFLQTVVREAMVTIVTERLFDRQVTTTPPPILHPCESRNALKQLGENTFNKLDISTTPSRYKAMPPSGVSLHYEPH